MSKKLVMLLFVGMFLFSAMGFLFAAGEQETGGEAAAESKEKVVLNFWSQYNRPNDKKAAQYVIDVFEKENPNATVEHRIMPNLEADQMLRTAFAGGNPPDVSISEDPYTMVKSLRADKIMNLSDWYDQYGDRFSKSAAASCELEGKYYGVPTTMSVEAHIFYNSKIANESGVAEPQLWSEFMELCAKAKGQGLTPISLGNKEGWPGLHWYQAFLGETVGAKKIKSIITRDDPNEGPHWTDRGFVKGAEYFNKLHTDGYVSEGVATMSYDASKMEYLGGKALFFFTGSWYTSFDFPPDFEWDFFRFPAIKGEPGFEEDEGTVDYLARLQVATQTDHKDYCYKFLDVYSRADVMHDSFYKFGGHIPAVKGAISPDEVGDFQKAAIEFAQTNDGSYGFIETYLPPEVGFGGLYNGTSSISAGEMTPQEFAENLEELHKEEMSKQQ